MSSRDEVRLVPLRKINPNVAELICHTYISDFLKKVSRSSAQRNAHYNGTIKMVYESCLYDVIVTGNPDVSKS
ncbi:unnamed protein product [Rotaria sp. Silwood2]|nr:unnamed protein product [Rotaria sp. Silwood2]CAF3407479.1 unnamed protein product [Rotaria sp. Silwood2]CAF4311932.1 unnamed protein product [Rotaria sp. Silwood2]CAF4474508.1 unnamed protein product [Rotaria sp. Silwood2]